MTRNHESQEGVQADLEVAATIRVGVALLAVISFSATARADVVTD